MWISIISKNGEKITKQNEDTLFESKEQRDRFWAWALESIPYKEAKERVEKLGYEVWEGDGEFGFEIPQKVTRFQIWRRVDIHKRKPELIEFDDMKLKIKIS